LRGSGEIAITGVDQLNRAAAGQITFVRDQKHADAWNNSAASAVLVTRGVTLEPGDNRAVIVVPNADLALATVLTMLAPPQPRPAAGVHPSATVDPSATLGQNVTISAHCVVGTRVVIGDNCVLHPGVCIHEDSTLGNDCELHANVV